MNIWYEISVYVDMKDLIIETTESLERAEIVRDNLKKKLLHPKITKWKIKNDKETLIEEIK